MVLREGDDDYVDSRKRDNVSRLVCSLITVGGLCVVWLVRKNVDNRVDTRVGSRKLTTHSWLCGDAGCKCWPMDEASNED